MASATLVGRDPTRPDAVITAVQGGAGSWAVAGLCLAATGPAAARWLRVAQREHYLAGSATRFAARWWRSGACAGVMAVAACAGLVAAFWWVPAAVVPGAAAALGPPGLAVRGRTSPLAWTRRLRTLSGVWLVLALVVAFVGVLVGQPAPMAAAGALLVPATVDLACAATAPIERRLAARFVARAALRLRRVAPTVVAITGSFGKTSTKSYVAHLMGASRAVVASPASFNNRAGLARAVNEHLADGTEIFVAEMGTYGPGEIAELCSWLPPDVAVITAVGPVHLERFGSEDLVLRAKQEIFERAPVAVLAVDDDRLAQLADRIAAEGRRVWRCSAVDLAADVSVVPDGGGSTVRIGGAPLARGAGGHAQPTNVACAVAVALHLGIERAVLAERLATLPAVAHRLEVTRGSSGALVLDDTYNSNPAGARAGLARLVGVAPPGGRTVVVTPGMVELGRRQVPENAAFAGAAAQQVSHLVVVGRTNRRALLRGARRAGPGSAEIVVVPTRQDAVSWVRRNVGPGDAVLYENDLPDHYP